MDSADPSMLKVTEPQIINHICKARVKDDAKKEEEPVFEQGESFSDSKISQLIHSVQGIKSLMLSKPPPSTQKPEHFHETSKTDIEKWVVNGNESILEDIRKAEISSQYESEPQFTFKENDYQTFNEIMFSPGETKAELDEIVLVCSEEYAMPEDMLEDDSPSVETDADDDLSLHEAVRQENLAAVRRILAQGADPDEPDWCGNGDPPLLQAVYTQNISIIKEMLEAGCHVNVCSVRGETALHAAVSCRPVSTQLISLLVSAGCDANTQDKLKCYTALHRVTAHYEELAEVFELLAEITDVNLADNRRNTVLHHIAATSRNIPQLIKVLDLGADVNVQNDGGETALSVSLEQGWVQGAQVLIQRDTDVELTTRYRETALHIAARRNIVSVVAALLARGASVNARDLADNTPLHMAAGRGFALVVEQLLTSADVDLNAQNKEGATPLHVAVESGFVDVVEMLVSARQTDLEVETAMSLTPLDLAAQSFRRSSQPEIFQVLTRELGKRAEKQLG